MMNNSNPDVLEMKGVSLSYAGEPVLQAASLNVSAQEIVTLIGPNGAGKTTLVKLALGLLQPDQGQVLMLPGTRVAYMPQRLVLDDTMPITVERFLRINIPSKVSQAKLLEVLSRVRAEAVIHSPMQKLSGGELQRVLLARCLLREPSLLVLDEPSQGVDIQGQQELYEIIQYIRDQYQCAVLMVSHDLHLVMAATDKVVCLNRHICCTGCPESIKQHPEYLALFGESASNIAVYTHHHDHHHDAHGNVVIDKSIDND